MKIDSVDNFFILSIIVPVFNVELYLEKCLQSIADQTLCGVEVILINDGSTDNSLKICNDFVNSYKNFSIYTKENEGQGVARNFGLQKATGKYICYVDSDDWIEPELCKEVTLALDDSDADFANFGVNFISESGKVVKIIDKFGAIEMCGTKLFPSALIDKSIYSISWNKMYRRSFLVKNKILFPPIRANEDLFYSRAVSYFATKAIFIPKIYYHALVRQGSTSRKMSLNMFHISVDLIRYERKYFSVRLDRENLQVYFDAHVAKLFSYLLIQAAFRINEYSEYRSCFDVARSLGFDEICTNVAVAKLLKPKVRLMMKLCRYPLILRFVAWFLKKLRLASFIY